MAKNRGKHFSWVLFASFDAFDFDGVQHDIDGSGRRLTAFLEHVTNLQEERVRKRNCGFVSFYRRADAEDAKMKMHDMDVEGYRMTIG